MQVARCKIKSTVVYPARPFGSILPRLVRRECDHLVDCHLLDKSACPMGVMSIQGVRKPAVM